ncbi:MAG: hypothetical protein ACR2OZ_16070 [Verrucomicrobiales bacterium]
MATKAKSDKADVGLGVSPRWIRCGIIVAALALALLGLWRVELLNRRVQAERRFKQNPRTAEWFARMNDEVRAFQLWQAGKGKTPPSSRTLAEAVWLGTVTERPRNRPERTHPEVVMVRLKPAWRLAGSRSPKEEANSEVSIGVRDFPFAGGEPQVGERWLFAVLRRNGGYNFIRDAIRVP